MICPSPCGRGGVRSSRIIASLVVVLALGFAAEVDSAAAGETALDALLRAYPEELADYDATALIWQDGTRMPLSDGPPYKSFEEQLRHGSILDQIRVPYPAGAAVLDPQADPGRIRNRAFFDKMYGDCWKGEVAPRLVSIVWLPQSWGHTIRVTSVNGVAERLAEISAELDALAPAAKRFVYPPAGTYNCRAVADTGQPSMHSWGAAIDVNAAGADYWLWTHAAAISAGRPPRLPAEIVDIFERRGFIWGGKWSHYDTMHFEYRPELVNTLPAAVQSTTAPR
jgi:D-alanyl-D-alanine carboxypeptidase